MVNVLYQSVFVKVENVRRKHNYLPLIVEILKVLGQEGKLVDLVEKVGWPVITNEIPPVTEKHYCSIFFFLNIAKSLSCVFSLSFLGTQRQTEETGSRSTVDILYKYYTDCVNFERSKKIN